MKKKVEKNAVILGYEIEFTEDNKFLIQEGKTEYYLKIEKQNLQLVKIVTERSPKTDIEVVDNKGMITITPLSLDKVEVSLEDTIEKSYDNGNVEHFNEKFRFVCGEEFSKESIDTEDSVSLLGKAERYYNKITRQWISEEELKNLYQRGLFLVEIFMKD